MRTRVVHLILALALAGCVAGCSYFRPLPPASSYEERLSVFPAEDLPLRGRAVLYWDEHQIPFIEADHDEDAAFVLGLVHAHLRLGHMELMRRVSEGRLSAYVGAPLLDVDHAVRTLDFARAVPEIKASMPAETRRWLEAFLAGVNHYLFTVEDLPQEFAVLGLRRQAWTLDDLLRNWRLAASDANWTVWLTLLQLRDREDWPELWAQLNEEGTSARTLFDGMEFDDLDEVLGGYRLAGSNAVAIGPARSETGSSLFAADPHVAYIAPTIWLAAGVKSPSYHVVGLMPTGFPLFAIGRNPHAAWGGTNLYSASSSFYDVSALGDDEIEVKTERLQISPSRQVQIRIRETQWGPIISDVPQLRGKAIPPVALRWIGHLPSDEASAMLAASRARSFEEFHAAFSDYAVSGMNMLYADKDGDVGHIQAAMLPRRSRTLPPDIVRDPAEVEPYWQSFVDATTLPVARNPELGYVASANNEPPPGEVPVGLFFSTDDRIERISELMREFGTVGVEEIKALQQDVYMQGSVEVRDALLATIMDLGLAEQAEPGERALLDAMASWDGHYRSESRGALAFELLRREFVTAFYGVRLGTDNFSGLTNVIGWEFLILSDLEREPQDEIATALRQGLPTAATEFETTPDWGAVHRLELSHPFSAIPLVGRRYRFGNVPTAGSIQTLAKSGHKVVGTDFKPHHGATARFVSDLSDLDNNYVVLVSGQDGWFNSPNFLDQMPLFLDGGYIPLPLRPESFRARARHVHVLERGG